MAQNSDTRPVKGLASRDLAVSGWSRTLNTLSARRAQIRIAAHHVRPELAAMVAALALGGGPHG